MDRKVLLFALVIPSFYALCVDSLFLVFVDGNRGFVYQS